MFEILTMEVGDFAIWQYILILIVGIIYIWWKGR